MIKCVVYLEGVKMEEALGSNLISEVIAIYGSAQMYCMPR